MTQHPFYELFVDQLKELFDVENQIIEHLPKVIQSASDEELKEALAVHLDETKNQLQRLKKIFKTLNENATGSKCAALQGIFEEGEAWMKKSNPSAVKDAGIIVVCQKIEHYEIASYGSVRALARHLNDSDTENRIDFDDIADMLQQTLDEESSADEKLTDLAEGGFFNQGINEEAQKGETATKTQTAKIPTAKTRSTKTRE